MKCRWCGSEFDDEELCVLDIDLPNCKQAHIRITNHLCPSCQKRVLETLGALELEIAHACA